LRSDENRMRVIPVPAPRGAVFDRNGELIAETVTSYSLHLQPTTLDSARVGLLLLQSQLGLTPGQIDTLVTRLRERPSEPLLLSRALTFDQVSWLEEHRTALPALTLEAYPHRHYPQGDAVAHLIGHVA